MRRRGIDGSMNMTISARAEQAAPLLETWLEAGKRARFILGGDASLEWRNRAGRQLLNRRDPLLLVGPHVRPCNSLQVERFLNFVGSASPTLSVLCLSDQDRDDRLIMSAVRLGSRGLVGITAFFASEGPLCHWADLREAFGLTPCERDIAQALAGGLTAESTAQKLHASVKTVRTHIRHVYGKLGVSSREELFRRLTPYMVVE
jgi:DNA-binding CsgD family transcriptional regulator